MLQFCHLSLKCSSPKKSGQFWLAIVVFIIHKLKNVFLKVIPMTLFLCLTFYCYNCAVEFLALVIIIGVNGSLILLMIKRDVLFSSRLLLSKNNLKHFKQNLKYLSIQHKKCKKGIKCNDLRINHKTHIGKSKYWGMCPCQCLWWFQPWCEQTNLSCWKESTVGLGLIYCILFCIG